MAMVTTLQIKPAVWLQPFVTCYALRSFDSGTEGILKPMFAVHESYMTLFLKGEGCKLCDIHGTPNTRLSHALVSLFTQSQGGTFYQGNFVIFSVQFKCNGISAIFGIPQRVLVNSILSLDDILGPDASLLAEQLADQPDLPHMGEVMNKYLTAGLQRQYTNANTPTICAASNLILKNYGMVSIDSLARYVNMSLRNFERRFTEEVGMPPKLYARITRFFTAIEDKALHPHKTWTDITYQYNYFDQAHFIKEVKAFSFRSPEDLFRTTPPIPEKYVTKVEY
jgi:AraC-like DNA-binding protein